MHLRATVAQAVRDALSKQPKKTAKELVSRLTGELAKDERKGDGALLRKLYGAAYRLTQIHD